MPDYIRKGLGDKLVQEGLITEQQFQEALKRHQETKVVLRQVLIDLGYISEDKLMEFMGAALNIPVMRNLLSQVADPRIIEKIPKKFCSQHMVLPLFINQGVLIIAMADPFDVFVLDDLKAITKCKIDTVLGKKDEIRKAIETLYSEEESHDKIAREAVEEAETLEIIQRENEEEENIAESMIDAPIIRLVDNMISQAIKERASDIHIEPDEKTLRIRFRVDGVLREAMQPPKRLQASIISRIKVMAAMDISIKRTPQDGRFKIRKADKDFDVRISSVPTIFGEKVVMRLLDQTSIKIGLEQSGFSEECLRRFHEMIRRPYGIILVTGPTGSGKTTTLYLALQEINTPQMNIITIEEPVEYDIQGINQISVNVKAGVTFASGLRSILRQDPDIIMVGEMRDIETADIAIRAALTGHLVFSTLHTNDAPSSIARVTDMGVPPYLVTSAICCVMAQRLLRKICPNCKESYTASVKEIEEFSAASHSGPLVLYRGRGCEECAGTGYLGRIGIFELMILDREIRRLIQEGASGDAIRDQARKAGMKTLWDDGADKVLKGHTSLEELKRVTFINQE